MLTANGITKIVIPKSVTTLEFRAFFGTSWDCEVYVPFTEEEGAPNGWTSGWDQCAPSTSFTNIHYAEESTQ